MIETEVTAFLAYLQEQYPGTFPVLTVGMRDEWIDSFEAVTKPMAWRALKEWRAWHPPSKPPSRKQLLDIIVAAAPEMRPVTATAMPQTIAILVEAAAHAPHAHDAWAKCHVEMVQEGLGVGDMEATAQRCETYALAYPDDAPYWHQEADWWRQGAPGRLRLGA